MQQLLTKSAERSGDPVAKALGIELGRFARAGRPDRMPLISAVVLRGLVRTGEWALIAAIGLALAYAYVPETDLWANLLYPAVACGGALAVVAALDALGLYAVPALTAPLAHLHRIALGWSATLAVVVAAIFFLKSGADLSRAWLAIWFAVGGIGIVLGRFALSIKTQAWARQGRLNRRAVVYGAGPDSAELVRRLTHSPDSDIRVCAVFDERCDGRAFDEIAGCPRLGSLDNLIAYARQSRIDMVILTLPLAAESRIARILERLLVLPVDVRLSAGASRLRLHPRSYSRIGAVSFIDLADKPIADWGTLGKWLFDKAVALAAILALAPLMAAVAVAIKLDSRGPVLFRQKRYGFNNELIEIFKFRSMYVDKADAEAARLVTKGDPRVTPIGRFIRKTSIDELPQLFNVLLGDLSLVGPRPHAVQAKAANRLYNDVVDSYFARHRVKPGITGWAQINGWRGETDTEEKIRKRVEHDIHYIDNWSLWLDVYILVKTPFALLATDNAY